MKNRFLIHIFRHGNIFQMENQGFDIDCIYMVVMTALTESGIAKMTM